MQRLVDHLQETKTAVTVTGLTFGTSVSQILDLIPDNIGKLGVLVTIILSVVLIYNHIKNGILERRETRLAIKQRKRDLDKDV